MKKKEEKTEKIKEVKKFKVDSILILLKINGIEAIHLRKNFKDSFLTKEEWIDIINKEGIIINE